MLTHSKDSSFSNCYYKSILEHFDEVLFAIIGEMKELRQRTVTLT